MKVDNTGDLNNWHQYPAKSPLHMLSVLKYDPKSRPAWPNLRYYNHFTPMQIAKHIQCLIAAKHVAHATRLVRNSLAKLNPCRPLMDLYRPPIHPKSAVFGGRMSETLLQPCSCCRSVCAVRCSSQTAFEPVIRLIT